MYKKIEKIDLADKETKNRIDKIILRILNNDNRIDKSADRRELGFTSNRYDLLDKKKEFLELCDRLSSIKDTSLEIRELMIHRILAVSNQKINWHSDREHSVDPLNMFGTIVYYPHFNEKDIIQDKYSNEVTIVEPGDFVFIHPDLIHRVPAVKNRSKDRISLVIRFFTI